MFAYCGNNPISREDAAGCCFVSAMIEKISDIIKKTVAAGTSSEPINGQGNEPYASMRFGTSDVKTSGCGAIAVHNTLSIFGIDSSLFEWLQYFESISYLRYFGVKPWEIPAALETVGLSCIGSSDPSIVDYCKSGGVLIMYYWCETYFVSEPATQYHGPVYGYFRNLSKGMHIIAVTYQGDQYCIYNSNNWNTDVIYSTDLSYYTGEGKFFYGFYVYQNP